MNKIKEANFKVFIKQIVRGGIGVFGFIELARMLIQAGRWDDQTKLRQLFPDEFEMITKDLLNCIEKES